MNKSDHYQKLQNMYLSAPVQKLYPGTSIEISEGNTLLTLAIAKEFFHAADAVHGSVYFRMLDDAAFFAVSSIVTDVFVLTTTFNINLLRPVKEGVLRAEGNVTFQSRNLFVAEAILYNDKGKKIANGTGNFMKSKILLSTELGYQ